MAMAEGQEGAKIGQGQGRVASQGIAATRSGDAPRRRTAPCPARRTGPSRMPLAPGVKYRRILLKLSGEALHGQSSYGIDPADAGRTSPTS